VSHQVGGSVGLRIRLRDVEPRRHVQCREPAVAAVGISVKVSPRPRVACGPAVWSIA